MKTINEHLINLFNQNEIRKDLTIRNFRIVQKEGSREVSKAFAESEFEKYRVVQDRLFESDKKERFSYCLRGGKYLAAAE